MDPFYPLGRNYAPPPRPIDTSSPEYLLQTGFNGAYPPSIEIPPSYGSPSWMQTDSSFPSYSYSSSHFKPTSSRMDDSTSSSMNFQASIQPAPAPLKPEVTDELPPRQREAKRARADSPIPSVEAEQEEVSNDLKKICLPSVEMLSITVKTLSGHKLSIECDPSCLVLQMKHQIEAVNGVPAHEQRLMYGGLALNDYKPISDYRLQDRATVYMVVSLRGGCLFS